MKRKEKIALLKGLSDGTKSVQDLMPKELIHFPGRNGEHTYFINGEQVTEAEFEQARGNHFPQVICPGRDNEFKYLTEFGAELYKRCRHNSPYFAFVYLVF